MATHELVVNGVTLPVREVQVEQVDEGALLEYGETRLRITARDAVIETDEIGDLIESLMVDTPRYPEDTESLPERACLAFGGHFWESPNIKMDHEPERRVCAGCDADE